MADPTDDQKAIARIAFEESVRKLAAVQASAESLRGRASTVLGTASAIMAFLGGLALDRGPEGLQWAVAALALAAYGGVLRFTLRALKPVSDIWPAGQDTAKLAAAQASTEWFVHGRLATRYQESFDTGEGQLKTMSENIGSAVKCMVGELLLLACLLGLTATNRADPPPVPVKVTVTVVGPTTRPEPTTTTSVPAPAPTSKPAPAVPQQSSTTVA